MTTYPPNVNDLIAPTDPVSSAIGVPQVELGEALAVAQQAMARFIRHAERVGIYGSDLGMPHTKAMGDGLFELRLKAGEGIARLFHCMNVGRRVVMLHQFVKKTDKTPARELLIARTRMKEIQNG